MRSASDDAVGNLRRARSHYPDEEGIESCTESAVATTFRLHGSLAATTPMKRGLKAGPARQSTVTKTFLRLAATTPMKRGLKATDALVRPRRGPSWQSSQPLPR